MTTITDIPTQDLPYWMRQAQRRRDWGILLALVFGLLAALPFMIYPGLPHTNAAENYVYMTAEYADTLQEGRLYPRWSSNALGGFGAPIPNFFPPGAPYTAAVIKVLFTDDAVISVRILFVLAFSIAAVMTYGFVRQRTTAQAGLLATALYVFSPYVGQVAPHVRGDHAVVVGLALLPLLLWSANRLLVVRRTGDIFVTTLTTTALLVTHPQLAATGITICIMLVLWHTRSQPAQTNTWVLVIISLSLGIGMAAFYWIPAFLERDLVDWVERLKPPLVSLSDLFSLPRSIDPAALQPQPDFSLGLLPLLALISGIHFIRQRDLLNFHLMFLLVGGVDIMVVLILPAENWLLGVISLSLACSASGIAHMRTRLDPRWQHTVLIAVVCLISLPVLYTPPWPVNFGGVQAIDQIRYEQRGFGIAVLPPEAPLPSSLSTALPANHILLSGYETGNLNKIVPASSVRVVLVQHTAHHDSFQITASGSTTLDFLTAYFPGWQAVAGNETVSLRRNPLNDLMLLDVPPMNGELTISFGPTPTRQMAWLVTWGSLFILLLLSWRGLPNREVYPPEPDLLDLATLRSIIFVMILFGTGRMLYTSQPGIGLANSDPLNQRTEAGLEILAYDLAAEHYQPGGNLEVNLYWQTVTPLLDNFQILLTLVNTTNAANVQTTTLRAPGHYPTRRWRAFRYVTDTYQLTLPQIDGTYRLQVEVFECNPTCANRLTFFDAEGSNLGPALTLPAQIVIAR